MSLPPPTVTILDTPVHNVTMAETLATCEAWMDEPQLHLICTSNPEFVMRAQDDPAFRQILHKADLCLPDGIGLLLAAALQRKQLAERVAGSDLVYHLAKLAADNGWRLFLLGAGPGVAEEAAAAFVGRYPTLQIAGTYAGTPALAEQAAIIERINRSKADILYVAYGAPKQEKWIEAARPHLETVQIAIGVGGSLDFVAGRIPRAPVWMQKNGLEWLYRLYLEPWRWRRTLAIPRFLFRILTYRR